MEINYFFNLLFPILLALTLCLGIGYFFYQYRLLRIPRQFHFRTVSTRQPAIAVAQQFWLELSEDNDTKFQLTSRKILPFMNYRYRKNCYLVNTFPLRNRYQATTGLELDYILGRVFLANYLRNNFQKYGFIFFVIYLAPALVLVLFWLFLLANIVFFGLQNSNQAIFNNNRTLIVLKQINLFLVLDICCWGGYLFLLLVQPYLKKGLETEYHFQVLPYVKQHYHDLYSDFLVARRFSFQVWHCYATGWGWLFILLGGYRYLGFLGSF